MEIREQAPLAPLTTLGVGGPARFLAAARTEDEAREAVNWAAERRLPLFVLGGGSNLLVADSGWPGLVLQIAITGIGTREVNGERIYTAGAGEDWDALVARAVGENCAGIECLSGIPGTVGGTPIQNVGAYGQEVAETIRSVRVLDVGTGVVEEIGHDACGFHYRTSRFNTRDRGRYIVLQVSYALRRGGQPHIVYPDLKRRLEKVARPTLSEVRETVRAVRRSKAMLLVPGDPDARSAGSFFKNPVVESAEFTEIEARAQKLGLEVPSFAAEAKTKVPAAWLIEHSGFARGYTRGAVGISSKHALAIVNRGGARAAEVLALAQEIRRAVHDTFGVELQPEPVLVGFEESAPREASR